MKKLVLFAATAALVLASCAKIENDANVAATVDVPVGFAPYTSTSVTKAGAYGEIDDDALKTNGFGVFAYQTTGDYSASAKPNFMYNTKVSTASWTYSPIKYWPNQIQSGKSYCRHCRSSKDWHWKARRIKIRLV